MWVNRSGCSPKMSYVSESLRLLTKNERPWAICAGRSEEMSDCEQIAQIANQKWANEWIANFLERIAHSLIFGQKTRDSLGKPMSEFPALWFFELYLELFLWWSESLSYIYPLMRKRSFENKSEDMQLLRKIAVKCLKASLFSAKTCPITQKRQQIEQFLL